MQVNKKHSKESFLQNIQRWGSEQSGLVEGGVGLNGL